MDRVREKDGRFVHCDGSIPGGRPVKVLILDNYDSFVYNLAQYVGQITGKVVVKRNDEIDVVGVKEVSPDKIVSSPGPGHASATRFFGACTVIVRKMSRVDPTISDCVGN